MRETVERIQRMERLFDEVNAAQECDERIAEKVRELEAYMQDGQWLRDYECDEMGLLPSDLKRGVLSEDGLYNLLADIWEKENEV